MKYASGLAVHKSSISGLGCFATLHFYRLHKIAIYSGERISQSEVSRRIAKQKVIKICGIDQRWAIDGNVGGNETQYINHSCQPNCFTRVSHGNILILALRNIEPGEELTIEIEDTGSGIAEEDKRRLFDAYFRGKNSNNTIGEGIGLYVVKENLNKINGKINVESELGKGSKFIIKIPKTIII